MNIKILGMIWLPQGMNIIFPPVFQEGLPVVPLAPGTEQYLGDDYQLKTCLI